MSKQRLDAYIVARGQAPTRSQAESMIRLGDVRINGQVVLKPGTFVAPNDQVKVADKQRYVSRAGLKLASVADQLKVNFQDKVVLDVGSSTGGFTDYALQHGARKVIAVDVGTGQLHPTLRADERIELHEKTDIRDVAIDVTDPTSSSASTSGESESSFKKYAAPRAVTRLLEVPDIIVIDVSFISLRDILPHIARLSGPNTGVVAMVKPQFEAGRHQVNKGVIKNDSVRRQILSNFEAWVKQFFVIQDKYDSQVAGAKGNRERFYLLKKVS